MTAIDNAANMLTEARRHHPGPDYRLGDAEALPFDEGTFDAAVSNFGILHFALPEVFIGEAFRVLKHGGRFVCTDWCPPAESPDFALVMGALREHGNMDIPLPEGPAMFQFAHWDHAETVFTRLGFVDFLHEQVAMVSVWERDEQMLGQFLEGEDTEREQRMTLHRSVLGWQPTISLYTWRTTRTKPSVSALG